MSEDTATVTIRLLDKEYRVSCTPDERNDLRLAADLLDGKMREMRDAQIVGLDRIAVMAALNLSHELVLANRSLGNQQDHSQRLASLTERIDREIRAFNDYRNTLV